MYLELEGAEVMNGDDEVFQHAYLVPMSTEETLPVH